MLDERLGKMAAELRQYGMVPGSSMTRKLIKRLKANPYFGEHSIRLYGRSPMSGQLVTTGWRVSTIATKLKTVVCILFPDLIMETGF